MRPLAVNQSPNKKPRESIPHCGTCGRDILLSDQQYATPGLLITCPRCGSKSRVWQLTAKANRGA